MVNFTKDERNLIEDIKITVNKFFPYDFDYSTRENLIRALKYWKAKGFCMSFRADKGVQNALYIDILEKLGVKLSTRKEILKKESDQYIDDMLKQVDINFEQKIGKMRKRLKNTEIEKSRAINMITEDAKAQIVKLEKEKAEALERLHAAETAVERLEAARKERQEAEEAEDNEEAKNDTNRTKTRKCWNCGEWFKIAGGIYTKHIKECQEIEE